MLSDTRLGMNDIQRHSTGNERYLAIFGWERAIFNVVPLGITHPHRCSAGDALCSVLLGLESVMFSGIRLRMSDRGYSAILGWE